ncbi:MAG TPA: hypothetical protein VJ927_10915 [Actinomycetota bacterium]|nr:hypothetical protein [Actinomycetota bacterium]
MRKIIALLAASAVLSAAFVTPALGKKKAKPVPTKLFLHGETVIGENDSFTAVAEGYLPMDSKEPTGTEVKSRQITNYLGGPNPNCAGNNLFPVWSGPLSGTVKGDVKLTFSTVGTPGPVVVRIWPDINASMCDSPATGATDYVDPAGEVTVELPPGQGTVEAVMKGVNFKAAGVVIVQISPAVAVDVPDPAGSILNPVMARVLYDTPEFASALEFNCIPASGKTCTP